MTGRQPPGPEVAGPAPSPPRGSEASDTVGTGSAVAIACSVLTVAAILLGIAVFAVLRLV